MYKAGARTRDFSSKARQSNEERTADDKQSKLETVLSRKDAKIQQLIQNIKSLKEKNSLLESEQRESRTVIEEMRQLVDLFQSKLDETKRSVLDVSLRKHDEQLLVYQLQAELETAQRDAEQFRKEAAVLTRALAVSSMESQTDGLALMNEAQELLDNEELHAELTRLKEIETKYKSVEVRLAEDEQLRAQLSEQRIENDFLRHKLEAAESLHVSLVDDRERWQLRCDELEATLAKLGAEVRQELDQRDECMQTLSMAKSQYEQDILSLELSEKRLKQRVSELEGILLQRDAMEQSLNSETAALRSSVSELDTEVRSLAVSLAAEAEANSNLAHRLEKVEADRERLVKELAVSRRRENERTKELDDLTATKTQNDELRKMVFLLQNQIAEKDVKIANLEQSRAQLKETMGSEIERLSDEVEYMASTSASLSERYMQVAREKDRMKSLLAHETMARLGPLR